MSAVVKAASADPTLLAITCRNPCATLESFFTTARRAKFQALGGVLGSCRSRCSHGQSRVRQILYRGLFYPFCPAGAGVSTTRTESAVLFPSKSSQALFSKSYSLHLRAVSKYQPHENF